MPAIIRVPGRGSSASTAVKGSSPRQPALMPARPPLNNRVSAVVPKSPGSGASQNGSATSPAIQQTIRPIGSTSIVGSQTHQPVRTNPSVGARPSDAATPTLANRYGARPKALPQRPAERGDERRPKKEPVSLFKKHFKSVGPRTYEAEVMRAGNGNHYIVMSEGKPDDATGEIRKTRLFVFSEDFDAFGA